jgi:hypothetical protein
MIYIVQVYHLGQVMVEREVFGMEQVERIQAVYEDAPGYEVHFYPDTFRYMRMNQNIALS